MFEAGWQLRRRFAIVAHPTPPTHTTPPPIAGQPINARLGAQLGMSHKRTKERVVRAESAWLPSNPKNFHAVWRLLTIEG
jgi:hypothetical protein